MHVIFLFCLISSCTHDRASTPQVYRSSMEGDFKEEQTPANALKLIKAYPDRIAGYKKNKIYFHDGSSLIYDDHIEHKSFQQLLSHPDIEDQFFYPYLKGTIPASIEPYSDPGRIRNESFFKKLYGESPREVRRNLVEIIWCPKMVGETIKVTKVNKVHKALEKVSAELDAHPELKPYLSDIGGMFNWRKIRGTNRLSMHSFGMTIDINTRYSDYWQWTCRCTEEEVKLPYQNRIPQKIVDIFEKNGFIWGGKWYHYDTMHFEYRPELL